MSPSSQQSTTSLVQELQTLRDFVRWALSNFNRHHLYYGHGTDNAWDEALHLVLGSLHLPWDTDERLLDARLTQLEREKLLELIRRRCEQRTPLPYLLGESWFAGLCFKVDARVLIPRSPIAELIQDCFSPWFDEDHPPARILDLCTGSGCIGIACAYAFPTAHVVLSDVSEDALDVARENISRHHLADRVAAVPSDLFANLKGEQFDLIVSNPPYVDVDDLANMPEEYHQEPELALAAGDDGLELVRVILSQARRHLTDGGLLVVEVGNSQTHLEAQFPQVPFLWVEFESDARGVFVLTADQLDEFQSDFDAACN
ncbi:50S ribosomal protein L3 N(5)-glutamine methyltransferase [Marinospirillum alkaliphilum]|uniref:Ribosomal protein uL3 glutamine methyltransferase n=1 Tax=Marinospirillum alkaliphilum DSM 21637 TaxID=1122209 RepID=A0A1K1X7P4_9GAMM|nr:50S ribosomal protein L3 N(5)-glutamine methyltransferase [Marinospirillum alkaliphilum]SFX45567.1 [LSU ribosomal protein L3P]-glutamine N5-methyltransferase [Marinospirillum alkaliphilum DSM 21637]